MKRTKPVIVAIDGPAGSGKSSICALVTARIGWTYVNTGALYRAVGLLARERGIDLSNDAAVAQMVVEIGGDLEWKSDKRALFYQGKDLTAALNSEEAGSAASKVAKLPMVRERLLPVQRQLTLSAPVGALVDGRDIGTVVFPDADLKIFLTASLEERSRRRLHQLGTSDSDAAPELVEDIKRQVAKRDERDSGRDVAPLKQAADAIVVDTSSMGLDATVEHLIGILRARGLLA